MTRSYSETTIKKLWGRAANRCSICRKVLTVPRPSGGDESVLGEMAHIIAHESEGEKAPRTAVKLSPTQRDLFKELINNLDSYVNLILLCRDHHKIIDDQYLEYPIERLLETKRDHQNWVDSALEGYDPAKQKDEELYAEFVDTWMELAGIHYWTNWTAYIFLDSTPELPESVAMRLGELDAWLMKRIWPNRYPALDDAFRNFHSVLNDFRRLFSKHAVPRGNLLVTEKFYKQLYLAYPNVDHKEVVRQQAEYRFHVVLLRDLGIELARAANKLCDEVRGALDPYFFIDEGRLSIRVGGDIDEDYREYVVLYREGEAYIDLKEFSKNRKTRLHYIREETED
jgi:hypothetical protein